MSDLCNSCAVFKTFFAQCWPYSIRIRGNCLLGQHNDLNVPDTFQGSHFAKLLPLYKIQLCTLFYFAIKLNRLDLLKIATKELKKQKVTVPLFLLGQASEAELNMMWEEQTNEILKNRKQRVIRTVGELAMKVTKEGRRGRGKSMGSL